MQHKEPLQHTGQLDMWLCVSEEESYKAKQLGSKTCLHIQFCSKHQTSLRSHEHYRAVIKDHATKQQQLQILSAQMYIFSSHPRTRFHRHKTLEMNPLSCRSSPHGEVHRKHLSVADWEPSGITNLSADKRICSVFPHRGPLRPTCLSLSDETEEWANRTPTVLPPHTAGRDGASSLSESYTTVAPPSLCHVSVLLPI